VIQLDHDEQNESVDQKYSASDNDELIPMEESLDEAQCDWNYVFSEIW